MTQENENERNRLRDVLEQYCDENGGGAREIEVHYGRYGGYKLTMVWDGFENKSSFETMRSVMAYVKDAMNYPNYSLVHGLHAVSFRQKALEDQQFESTPAQYDPPWTFSPHRQDSATPYYK